MLSLSSSGLEGICMSTLRVCAACKKRGAESRCSRCKCASYCCSDCQRAHWRDHKGVCKSLASSDHPLLHDGWKESKRSLEAVSDAAASSAAPVEDRGASLAALAFDLVSGKVGFLEGLAGPERIRSLPDGQQNDDEGLKTLTEAANLGNRAAQYQTALNYLPGGALSGTSNDDESELLRWVKLAAENGHAEAQLTYSCKYWFEGKNMHPTNYDTSLFWMRRALAHGIGDGGYPDPRGDVLSRKSFNSGLETAIIVARKSFLEEGPFPEGEKAIEATRLAADSGVIGAINYVCSIDRVVDIEEER